MKSEFLLRPSKQVGEDGKATRSIGDTSAASHPSQSSKPLCEMCKGPIGKVFIYRGPILREMKICDLCAEAIA